MTHAYAPPALREGSKGVGARAAGPRGRVRVTEASRAEPFFHHHRDDKSQKVVRLYTNYA